MEISVQEAKILLNVGDAKVHLIDVREPHEWEICHVDGAPLMPMSQIPESMSTLPPNEHLLIMCHHSDRSQRVTEFLRSNGFETASL
ncbi:MAG: hypothetical protein J6386_13800 [Candidatus Synoicihabitans palmerolidicus]|nr:hypothetical protein [Candidatus Synoicihabitans palmerolidicus]